MKIQAVSSRPIVVCDDEMPTLRAMETILTMAGFENLVLCQDSRELLPQLARTGAEAILLDLTMPHLGGEELLGLLSHDYPEIPVIIVTGTMAVASAVRCIKTGAFDYLVKPVEDERLVTVLRHALAIAELKKQNTSLKATLFADQLLRPEVFGGIVTRDRTMIACFRYAEAIARSHEPVLITGETGVGKDLLADAIHRLSGQQGEFVAFNAAGMDETFFSDTLFGHEKGAYTGATDRRKGLIERAQRGSLFFDEIGDLDAGSQAKLLRLLQNGEYYPLGADRPRLSTSRVLAATNQDLDALQKEGRFRKDLCFRLQVHHIELPPLRARLNDLPILVDHFLGEAAEDQDRMKPTVPRDVMALLESYSFPGNVRELRGMVVDAFHQGAGQTLSPESFKTYLDKRIDISSLSPRRMALDGRLLSFSESMPTLNQGVALIIEEALRRSGGNQTRAAHLLGISQQALSRRLKG